MDTRCSCFSRKVKLFKIFSKPLNLKYQTIDKDSWFKRNGFVQYEETRLSIIIHLVEKLYGSAFYILPRTRCILLQTTDKTHSFTYPCLLVFEMSHHSSCPILFARTFISRSIKSSLAILPEYNIIYLYS